MSVEHKFDMIDFFCILKINSISKPWPRLVATTICLLMIPTFESSAQTEETVLQQLSSHPENQTSLNGVIVNQQGTNNEAYIRQVTTTHSNGVETLQIGIQNQIQLMQTGNYLDIRIDQNGTGNLYTGDIEGEDTAIDIRQNGIDNIIFQSLYLSGSYISIRQQGNENEVIHTGNTSNSGIKVQQQGSGMKLIIQSN